MHKLIFYSLFITVIVFSGLTFSAVPVMATSIDYVPLAPLDVRGSEFTSGTSCIAPTCFPKYLRTIYNVGVALAGLFAVFSIVHGGFELLFTDSILGHSEGKAIILRALGGLVIVYSSYIFMNQISPSLGRDLDLSLAFERVPKAETGRGLTVVAPIDYDELEKDFAELRKEVKDVTKKKEEHAQDLKDQKKAEDEAEKIADPVEKARVQKNLANNRKDIEKNGRMIDTREFAATAQNRIKGDFNSALGLGSLRGEYTSRLPWVQVGQLEDEIEKAEKVLNDNGELAGYVAGQLNKVTPLINAATSDEEKGQLTAVVTGTRTMVTTKRALLQKQIKIACDSWRNSSIPTVKKEPVGCERYK